MADSSGSKPEAERREEAVFANIEEQLNTLEARHGPCLKALSELIQLLNERIETAVAGSDDLYDVLIDVQRTQLELQRRLDEQAASAR